MQPRRDNGFTLIELLVAMAISSIVMAAVASAYFVQVRGKNTQEALTDMNDTARAALEIMVHEIRMAGFDSQGTADAGILTAASDELRFTMDIGDGDPMTTFEPDGDADDANEDVRYAINASGDLGRETGGTGGLQALAHNVDALNFIYLDADGNITAALDQIRTIQVTLVARAEGGLTGQHTDNTAYENQQGDVIFTAPGDSFRRLRLTTTIACRNMN